MAPYVVPLARTPPRPESVRLPGVVVRICSGAGCLRAVDDEVRFCDECKPVRPDTDGMREHTLTDRERYAFLYSGTRWQRTRAAVVAKAPLCEHCQRRPTEIVDHVVPAGVAVTQAKDSGLYKTDRWAGFYFRSNLQGLCRMCHIQKTIDDKTHTGAWPDVVEAERTAPKRRWSF